jgi:hypothetical protein
LLKKIILLTEAWKFMGASKIQIAHVILSHQSDISMASLRFLTKELGGGVLMYVKASHFYKGKVIYKAAKLQFKSIKISILVFTVIKGETSWIWT